MRSSLSRLRWSEAAQKACVPGGGTMGHDELRALIWILQETLGYHFREGREGKKKERHTHTEKERERELPLPSQNLCFSF